MLRHVLLVTPFVLLGCAAPNPSASIAGDGPTFSYAAPPPPVDAAADSAAAAEVLAEIAPDSQRPPPQAGPPQAGPPRPRERFSIKGGYYGSSEDGIDDGYIINLAWKRPTAPNFSTEVEVGYLDASGSDNGVDRDVWAVPLMANGRFDIPVGERLEAYVGLGLGSIYYEADAKAGGIKVSADGFLFAGDAYFGGGIHLRNGLVLGLEGKYYVTDSASDLGGGLDAYVVLLTVGFER